MSVLQITPNLPTGLSRKGLWPAWGLPVRGNSGADDPGIFRLMRVVLIPGWNENGQGMRVFAEGRNGLPGLAAAGYECVSFDGGRGGLNERIDQLAEFLSGVRANGSPDEPTLLLGYSAGGIIARGLMRSRQASEWRIGALFQLGAPNGGIVTDHLAGLLHRIHFSMDAIDDLDLESPFMQWLNGTTGHWETDSATHEKHWRPNKKPWITARDVPILNLIGRVPHYRCLTDGVVFVDLATLGGYVPHAFVDDPRANHLNLSGSWNPMTLTLRRWFWDDRLWPKAVDAAARFFASAGFPAAGEAKSSAVIKTS